jgi:hypothetical protein
MKRATHCLLHRPLYHLSRALFAAIISAVAMHATAHESLPWDKAFPVTHSLLNVYFVAKYVDPHGQTHTLEAWRHGHDFLHRRTDNTLDLYAVEKPDGELHYRIIEHRRKIVADVTRTNLYRVGIFSDYAGLAYVLQRPKNAFKIEATTAPTNLRADNCSWKSITYDTAESSPTLACWSAKAGLPMMIATGSPAKAIFRVTAIDHQELPPDEWRLPDPPQGYAMVDVNDEINISAD